DPFQPDFAGMIEHNLAGFSEMLAISDRALRATGDELLQGGLPLDKRLIEEVAPVEIQQIEHVINKRVRLAGLERRLQAGEARYSFPVLDHDLAVKQRRACRQRRHSSFDIWKLARPIEAFAREQAHLLAGKLRLDAVSIEFDLVHPFAAGGRLRAQRGERGWHERRRARARGIL